MQIAREGTWREKVAGDGFWKLVSDVASGKGCQITVVPGSDAREIAWTLVTIATAVEHAQAMLPPDMLVDPKRVAEVVTDRIRNEQWRDAFVDRAERREAAACKHCGACFHFGELDQAKPTQCPHCSAPWTQEMVDLAVQVAKDMALESVDPDRPPAPTPPLRVLVGGEPSPIESMF